MDEHTPPSIYPSCRPSLCSPPHPLFFFSLRSSSQHAALHAAAAGQEMTCGHSVNCQSPPRERERPRGGGLTHPDCNLLFFPTLKIRKKELQRSTTLNTGCTPPPHLPPPPHSSSSPSPPQPFASLTHLTLSFPLSHTYFQLREEKSIDTN